MSVLRNVWADLVEKRLWPVAVALVVALVAVPVVLGRSAAPAPPAVPAAAPIAASAPAAEVVALRTGPTRARPGAPARDPFAATTRKPKAAAAPASGASASTAATGPDRGGGAAAAASGSAASPASGSSAAGASASAGSAPGSAPAVPPASPSPVAVAAPRAPAPPAAGYRVDVRFGPATDSALRRDLTRLAILGTPGAPVLIYLGVREGGRTVLFEVAGEGVAVTGDGRCLPSPRDCQTLELARGDAQFLDVPGAGGIVQYELSVEKIARKRPTTAARAARSRARFSKDGRRALRKVIAAGRVYVGRYEYSQRRGVVIAHAPKKPGA